MSRKITGLLRWQPDTPQRWKQPEHVSWLIRESVDSWLTQFESAAEFGSECPVEYDEDRHLWATVTEMPGATPVFQTEVFTKIPASEWVRIARRPALAAELFGEVLDVTTNAVVNFQKSYRPSKNTSASGWESELES